MAQYTRSNAWNNGGTFDNEDLLWYAKGVGAMMKRELSDPASWWFFAAIHGEYVGESGFPGWGSLPAPPAVPTSPLPSQSDQATYWDQCQHQSWYFLPWHRGYLLALEAQIRTEVINLGGPETWALPYWNYFGSGEDAIPPAFTEQTLPDNSPNPLFVAARYGPNNNGDIFIPMPPVNQACMSNDIYTGNDAVTPPPGFGGPQTGFWHGGGTSGNLENNPHNLVHVFVGGDAPSGPTYGLMSDPGIAALDPIFYFHHANIDRMWAAWNVTNSNPTDPVWLNGPAASGGREFIMPWPGGGTLVYTPQEMNSLDQLDYTYDDLPVPETASPEAVVAERLTRLGAPATAETVAKEGVPVSSNKNVELVGATQGPLPIKGSEALTMVKLDTDVRRAVTESLSNASEAAPPDRVFLNLENVRGTHDASVLNVLVNEIPAGSVGLFGLRRATLADSEHGGEGLNFVLEITPIVDALHLEDAFNADALHVRIVPHQPVPDQAEITVGRISVYRQGQ
jgi:tyrosinase